MNGINIALLVFVLEPRYATKILMKTDGPCKGSHILPKPSAMLHTLGNPFTKTKRFSTTTSCPANYQPICGGGGRPQYKKKFIQ